VEVAVSTGQQHQPQQPKPPGAGRLRKVLAATLVWGIVWLLVYLLAAGSTFMYWQGWEDMELRFAVVDAETGSPISGVVITAFRPGMEEVEPPVVARTEADGTTGMVVRCKSSGKATLFSRTGSVYLGWWAFRMSKEGYDTGRWRRLADYTGEGRKLGDLTLPTIRIDLKELPGKE
jgi:hypothetical protein